MHSLDVNPKCLRNKCIHQYLGKFIRHRHFNAIAEFLFPAKDKVSTPTTKTIFPSEVKDLENLELESDLVAPAPGDKPLVAKYTLRVKPKLLKGVPQMQEIRIMPPNKSGASGFVKPLMVLKQNITKPMIENIEIDVPEKGMKYSRKPSVEVIEGDHKEMLQVSKGQAIVEDPVQKSETESQGMLRRTRSDCIREL